MYKLNDGCNGEIQISNKSCMCILHSSRCIPKLSFETGACMSIFDFYKIMFPFVNCQVLSRSTMSVDQAVLNV